MMFKKISQNFVKSLKFCLISQILVHSLWHVCIEKKMAKLFANSGDPNKMQHSAASHVGLHCLPITLFGVFRLKMG